MQMNAHSRTMLMAKLGAAAGMAPPAAAVKALYGGASAPVVPQIGGNPSACIVIKNMFVLEQETNPGWEEEIKEDVSEECKKYGKVNHCYVENRIPGGFVYLRFAAMEAASDAAKSLNGRFFAGKMITVSFMNPAEYQAKFSS
jgi:RNA-binding protein 39